RRPRNGWPPRTPRSGSASASSATTTGPWKTGWKPPAPTTGSPTGASPSSKPSSPSAPQPAKAAATPRRIRPPPIPPASRRGHARNVKAQVRTSFAARTAGKIDESHNFRNADYAEERESRYQRLMHQVIQEGVKTKVLMLSATPVNKRFNDL